MKHYLVIGLSEPGGHAHVWRGQAKTAEEAASIWREDAWNSLGLDADERDAAADEGMYPQLEHLYMSDSPVRLA